MNAPSGARFRLVEDPLGPLTLERPSREAWDAMIAREFAKPVPDYSGVTLRRLILAQRA